MLASGSEAVKKRAPVLLHGHWRDSDEIRLEPAMAGCLLLEQCVQAGLSDRLIDLRFGATGGDATENLSVDNNGQPSLVRKEVRISERFQVVLPDRVFGSFGRTLVERRVASFLL